MKVMLKLLCAATLCQTSNNYFFRSATDPVSRKFMTREYRRNLPPRTLQGERNIKPSMREVLANGTRNKRVNHEAFSSTSYVENCKGWVQTPCSHLQQFREGFLPDSSRSIVTHQRNRPSGTSKNRQYSAAKRIRLDLSSCNKMIARYVRAGQHQKALLHFHHMQQEGITPNKFTFIPLLKACADLLALDEGKSIHSQIIQSGCGSDLFVCSSLIDMYAKCGCLEGAQRLFDNMPSRDVVTWNTMLRGYAKLSRGREALALFEQMQREGFTPTRATILGVLQACGDVGNLEEGKLVHEQIIRSGFESDWLVANGLLDMYAKCRSTEDQLNVFHKMWSVFNDIERKTVDDWTAMIQGCVKCGGGDKALELFQWLQREKVEPNRATFVGVLRACASLKALERGRQIHRQIRAGTMDADVYIGSNLVDMYAKCGSMYEAEKAFSKIATPNVVAWSTMILGFVNQGQSLKALEFYQNMQQAKVQPNRVTFLGLLNACADLAALDSGRNTHKQIMESGYSSDTFVRNALIDMYAKCGSVEDAENVFRTMPIRDIKSWTAMLGGYGIMGMVREARFLFERMCQERAEMDAITFVCLLSACSHAGVVDEGIHLFESMGPVHGVAATTDHYACMVDLLGRAGRLHEAEDMIRTMNCPRNISVWMALLGACKVHRNVELGERVAKQVISLDSGHASGYVLLSNLYSASGNWAGREAIQLQKAENAIKKEPGCSWIEVNNQIHIFTANDQRHPRLADIHAELNRLGKLMGQTGYAADTAIALQDAEEEEKVCQVGRHSEKLAIAFGLISTPLGSPLRIIKNLRVCSDCHTVSKLISKITGREIILRDATRFHHVCGGLCSCGDYW